MVAIKLFVTFLFIVSLLYKAYGDVKLSCEDCINMADSIANSLMDINTVQYVASAFDAQVCAGSSKWSKASCSLGFQALVSQLMPYLKSNFPKDTLCSNLDRCPSSGLVQKPQPTMAIYDLFFAAASNPKMTQGQEHGSDLTLTFSDSYPYCDYCQLVVGELRMLIMQDDAKALVVQYTDEICKLLPYDVDKCLDLVSMYMDEVFDLINQYMDPPTLCSVLEYCGSMRSAETVEFQ
eukprot:TRINITY_DN179_c0_g3_i1.p1 TRINITY_DN179_c0_g3~~TRINITY_DN179_c0_g3_i1.p1  ORF type:complete len:265 (-),score=7.75 TRINITY_DN179_c0_g3_i1:1054-1761(-)